MLLRNIAAVALAATLSAWSVAQDEAMDAVVAKCKADAAWRMGADLGDVSVESAEAVTWPSGALGCPKPGMDYTMALVPGFKIILEADGETLEYHTDRGDHVVLCETPELDGDPGTGPEDPPTALAGPSVVLVLEPNPDDPNLNGRLVALGADGKTTVLDECADFAASGRHIIAKRRASRSTHDLVLISELGESEVVATAFDFEGLTFLEPTSVFVYMSRESVGQPYRLFAGDSGARVEPIDWAPSVRKAQGAWAALHGDVLALNFPEENGGDGRVVVLRLGSEEVVVDGPGKVAIPVAR